MSIQSYLLQIRLSQTCQLSVKTTAPLLRSEYRSEHFQNKPPFSWFRWKKTLQTRTTFNPLTCTTSQSLSDCLVHIQSDQRQTGYVQSIIRCNQVVVIVHVFLYNTRNQSKMRRNISSTVYCS